MNENRTTLAYNEYFSQRKLWEKREVACFLICFSSIGLGALFEPQSRAVSAAINLFGIIFLFAGTFYCSRKTAAVDDSIGDAVTLAEFRERYTEDSYIKEGHPWHSFWKVVGRIVGSIAAILTLSLCTWFAIEVALLYLSWPPSLMALCALILFVFILGASSKTVNAVLFEHVETFNGKRVVSRLSTKTFLTASLLCIPFGIWLIFDKLYIGAALILTVCPCLLLYPVIRGLFFGGKDSVAGVVTTVIVEETTKSYIQSAVREMGEKGKRRK